MYSKLIPGNLNSYFNDISILNFLLNNKKMLSGKVLDVGCGKMKYKKIILEEEPVDEYIGLDLEDGKFSYSVNADIYWDGITIPLPSNSIESTILFEVLEHCKNPSIILKEIYRVLKPGGVLLFSTPFLYQLHGVPFDYQRLTPSGMLELLDSNGFSATHIQASGVWDASLGQMISIWLTHRPMHSLIRRILRRLFVPIFKYLIYTDKKFIKQGTDEHAIMPGILGYTYKHNS